MLPDGLLDRVQSLGFDVARGVLTNEHAADLRERLARLAQEDADTRRPEQLIDANMVHNPMLRDSAFMDLLDNVDLIAAVDGILGDTSIVYAYTTSSMPAGGSNYSNRIHVDSPRIIENYPTNIGVIIALDDFTAENGATYFLPNSLHRLETPSEDEFFRQATRVFPRAGDMVVFHARCWHLGGANKTDSPRHAITINFCRSYMRQRFDYPRMITSEQSNSLSETQRRLLGYNVRVPKSLDEYYVSGEQRLYKAGQG